MVRDHPRGPQMIGMDEPCRAALKLGKWRCPQRKRVLQDRGAIVCEDGPPESVIGILRVVPADVLLPPLSQSVVRKAGRCAAADGPQPSLSVPLVGISVRA